MAFPMTPEDQQVVLDSIEGLAGLIRESLIDDDYYSLFQEDFEGDWPEGGEPPDTFVETFEAAWFIPGNSVNLFAEIFEVAWFLIRTFGTIFTDTLDSDWFFDRSWAFSPIFLEDFQNGGW